MIEAVSMRSGLRRVVSPLPLVAASLGGCGAPPPVSRVPVDDEARLHGVAGLDDAIALTYTGQGRLLVVAGVDPIRIYTLRADPAASDRARLESQVELRDPARLVPFVIVHQLTGPRQLTQADFAVASVQQARDGTLWLGDELGPFLLHCDAEGRVLEPPYALPDFGDDGQLRGPDSPLDEANAPVRLMRAISAHSRSHQREGAIERPLTVSAQHALLDDADPNTALDSRVAAPPGLRPASSEIFSTKRLQAAGFRVVPWTVNEPERMRQLLALGVDGMITDRPDLLYAQLQAFDRNADGTPGDLLLEGGAVDRSSFDLQGHRGARDLRPENTLPSMEVALDARVTTLELDVAVTSDGVPILSHDPVVNPSNCRRTHGVVEPTDADPIRLSSLAELQADWICDKTSWLRPRQTNERGLSPVSTAYAREVGLADAYVMPTLAQVYEFVEFYVEYYRDGPGSTHPDAARRVFDAGRVGFNVETKTNPARPDETVELAAFVGAVAATIMDHTAAHRTNVQSFDFRATLLVQEQFPTIATAWLFGDSPAQLGYDGANLENAVWRAGMPWPYRDSEPPRVAADGGLAGLGLSHDGRYLYPMLRRPLLDGDPQTALIFVFDVERRRYLPVRHAYPLDDGAQSVSGLHVTPSGSIVLVEGCGARARVYEASLTETNPEQIKRRLRGSLPAPCVSALWATAEDGVWRVHLEKSGVVWEPLEPATAPPRE